MMQRLMIQAEPELIERVKRRAAQRGVSASQVWREAARHEVGPDEEQIPPPLTFIGAFSSKRGDLSRRASEDEYEPEPFR
jgi:Ribbon-helix-helix protein, copG family